MARTRSRTRSSNGGEDLISLDIEAKGRRGQTQIKKQSATPATIKTPSKKTQRSDNLKSATQAKGDFTVSPNAVVGDPSPKPLGGSPRKDLGHSQSPLTPTPSASPVKSPLHQELITPERTTPLHASPHSPMTASMEEKSPKFSPEKTPLSPPTASPLKPAGTPLLSRSPQGTTPVNHSPIAGAASEIRRPSQQTSPKASPPHATPMVSPMRLSGSPVVPHGASPSTQSPMTGPVEDKTPGQIYRPIPSPMGGAPLRSTIPLVGGHHGGAVMQNIHANLEGTPQFRSPVAVPDQASPRRASLGGAPATSSTTLPAHTLPQQTEARGSQTGLTGYGMSAAPRPSMTGGATSPRPHGHGASPDPHTMGDPASAHAGEASPSFQPSFGVRRSSQSN